MMERNGIVFVELAC